MHRVDNDTPRRVARGYHDGYAAVSFGWSNQLINLSELVRDGLCSAEYRAGFIRGHADTLACRPPSPIELILAEVS